jgi:hypothetical protein
MMQMLGAGGSVILELMRIWDLTGTLPNPPLARRIPSQLLYLRQYDTDMAYATPYVPGETLQKLMPRVYDMLFRLTNNASAPGELRIVRKFFSIDWEPVWKNLHASGVPDITKSIWYAAIHDIIPTNDRLAANCLPVPVLVPSVGTPASSNTG